MGLLAILQPTVPGLDALGHRRPRISAYTQVLHASTRVLPEEHHIRQKIATRHEISNVPYYLLGYHSGSQ